MSRYPIDRGRKVKVQGRSTTLTGRVHSYRGRLLVIELDEGLPTTSTDHEQWAAARPVGDQIREARLAAGLHQSELGTKVGCHDGMVSRVENSMVMPNGNTLARFAKALDCALYIGPGHPQLKCYANRARSPKAVHKKTRAPSPRRRPPCP